MNMPVGTTLYESKSPQWLSEERFLKLHLELTLLAIAQVERRDLAEDIASQCLIDTWLATPPGDRSFPVKAVLLNRLAEQIECVKKSTEQQVAVGRENLRIQEEKPLAESAVPENLFAILQLIPLLELVEQQLFQLMIGESLDLPQIAERLQLPFSKVKRLYKNSIFLLRKKLGQWTIYQ